jgi:hypothetical protein
MAPFYNFNSMLVSIDGKRFIILPNFMALGTNNLCADVLAHAGSQSSIELLLEQHMAVIGLFTKSHGDILPGNSCQNVMKGRGLIAINFMLAFDSVHVKFDFPDKRCVVPLDSCPDALAMMMVQAGANDLLPPAQSCHLRSKDLCNGTKCCGPWLVISLRPGNREAIP